MLKNLADKTVVALLALALGGYAVYRVMSDRQVGLRTELGRYLKESAELTEAIRLKGGEIEGLRERVWELTERNAATDGEAAGLRAELAEVRKARPVIGAVEGDEAVEGFNTIYGTDLGMGAGGYVMDWGVLPQVVFNSRLGMEMVPYLERENGQLTLLVDAQGRSLVEKDGIIEGQARVIDAEAQRFEMAEARHTADQNSIDNLGRQLKLQKRRGVMWAVGAAIVGYVAGK